MNDMVKIRERFLKDDIPTRLGNLASNLRRIKSFSSLDVNQEVVKDLLDESKYFIEWTAAETEIHTAGELVELQILIARVTFNLDRIWVDSNRRNNLAEQAMQWSDRVLELSGLLS
jgi:hypothetical protein